MVDKKDFNPLVYPGLNPILQKKFVTLRSEEIRRREGLLLLGKTKFEAISEYICNYYKISIEDLFIRKTRKKTKIIPKRWVLFLTYLTGDYTLNDIASKFGVDHSNVIYHCSELQNQIKIYPETHKELKTHIKYFEDIFGKFFMSSLNEVASRNKSFSSYRTHDRRVREMLK